MKRVLLRIAIRLRLVVPNDHYREGDKGPLATHCIGVTGGPVPRFEKVEREEPAKGVVIEGDDP
ncbi:MAG: hypothetical protein ACRDMW_01130 [Gaiellaceae bacterium]